MSSPLNDLNNYLQGKKKLTSLSWQDEESGPRHEVLWTSTCKLDGIEVGTGSGPTKRLAKAAAAKNALAKLAESEETDAAVS
ncbi:hypothetical protein BDM02DRAFT_3181997 [Thelephora ganbajun]|uniref:Uncharacterized protein n=1 Tax=Thelephora ganbajun TaxID=370292 RepID=A0ACB6ZXG8_THEGA|nr:hypothetical protein BDM02DRAFT_3181997 [Thelephora ganbajun]